MKKVLLAVLVLALVSSASALVPLSFPDQVTVNGVNTGDATGWTANNIVNGNGMVGDQHRWYAEPGTYDGTLYSDGAEWWGTHQLDFDQAYDVAEVRIFQGGYIHRDEGGIAAAAMVEYLDGGTWVVAWQGTLTPLPFTPADPTEPWYPGYPMAGVLFDPDVVQLGVTTTSIKVTMIAQAPKLYGRSGNIDPYIAEAQVMVPEPATMMLLGLGGLALIRKRR